MLQKSIDHLRNCDFGMQASREKYENVVLHDGPNFRTPLIRGLFAWKPKNLRITRKVPIGEIGPDIEPDSQATTYVNKSIKKIKRILDIIKRFTTRPCGLKER